MGFKNYFTDSTESTERHSDQPHTAYCSYFSPLLNQTLSYTYIHISLYFNSNNFIHTGDILHIHTALILTGYKWLLCRFPGAS